MINKIDYMCSVMQEAKRGKQVQWRPRMLHANYSNGGPDVAPLEHPWCDDDNPTWNWGANEYRVKPEPRTWWMVPEAPALFSTKRDAIEFKRQHEYLHQCSVILVMEVLDGTD